MPNLRRPSVPNLLCLVAGLLVGATIVGTRPRGLQARGSDRWDDSVLATGPLFIRHNEGTKVQVAQDAVYYLDYRRGTLMGTVPMLKQTSAGSSMIDGFAERDLVADFKIDVDNGPTPHFLMTTGSVYQGAATTFGDGWAPLFVFEATTRQVAAYKIQQLQVGNGQNVRLDLVEIRPFGRSPAPAPATR